MRVENAAEQGPGRYWRAYSRVLSPSMRMPFNLTLETRVQNALDDVAAIVYIVRHVIERHLTL